LQIILCLPGESYNELFELFIEEAIQFYGSLNLLSSQQLPLGVATENAGDNVTSTFLSFPGKVAVDKSGKNLPE